MVLNATVSANAALDSRAAELRRWYAGYMLKIHATIVAADRQPSRKSRDIGFSRLSEGFAWLAKKIATPHFLTTTFDH